MSPEQQRIAIAEACGWDCSEILEGEDGLLFARKEGDWDILPDYLNDLNAMHEACKTLTEQQELVFRGHLHTITRRDYKSGVRSQILSTINATAVQRCEAFLKTIRKWKDGNDH